MKIVFLATLAVVTSTIITQACTLTDSDIKALAASPSRLTPIEFLYLAPERQKIVCDTRASLRQVDAQQGVIEEVLVSSAKYLSPAENDRVIDATNDLLHWLLNSKKRE